MRQYSLRVALVAKNLGGGIPPLVYSLLIPVFLIFVVILPSSTLVVIGLLVTGAAALEPPFDGGSSGADHRSFSAGEWKLLPPLPEGRLIGVASPAAHPDSAAVSSERIPEGGRSPAGCGELMLLDQTNWSVWLAKSNCRDSLSLSRIGSLPEKVRGFSAERAGAARISASQVVVFLPDRELRTLWSNTFPSSKDDGQLFSGIAGGEEKSFQWWREPSDANVGGIFVAALSKKLPPRIFVRALDVSAREEMLALPAFLDESEFLLSGRTSDGRYLFKQKSGNTMYAWDPLQPDSAHSAEFGVVVNYQQPILGDFNGDRLTDILVRSAGVDVWWLALGAERSWREFPVSGLGSHGAGLHRGALAGDIDGDGKDELLRLSDDGSRIFVNRLRLKAETAAAAQSRNRPCLSYGDSGAFQPKWGRKGLCPLNFAWFEVDDKNKRYPLAHTLGTCCRLPYEDMLLSDEISEAEQCPENSLPVGTGGDREGVFFLRCRKLNTNRFRLGKRIRGRRWGIAYSESTQTGLFDRSDLPVWIRHGAGRTSYNSWDTDGCIAENPGAVYWNATGYSCEQMIFREIEWAGQAGDPPLGTRVDLPGRCKQVRNIFDPEAECMSDESQPSSSSERPRPAD